jgi:phosphatidylethanolamine/phosphatidyl-N-methylethanolamine N-methyltransferase
LCAIYDNRNGSGSKGLKLSAHKSHATKITSRPKNLIDLRLGDEARFIRSWLENPRLAGAISPSGRFLARAMAQCVDPAGDGPIVELGPGTGPVTQALLARGIAPERLVLVEFEPSFCHLLAKKFPGAKIVRGDAYRLRETLADHIGGKASAIVSSLPLLTKPEGARLSLLRQAFEMMGPDGRFIQFTYGVKSPVPSHVGGSLHLKTQSLAPIWLNLPPARIFVYRHADCPHAVETPPDVIDKILRGSRRFGREIRGEFEEARARLTLNASKAPVSKSRRS